MLNKVQYSDSQRHGQNLYMKGMFRPQCYHKACTNVTNIEIFSKISFFINKGHRWDASAFYVYDPNTFASFFATSTLSPNSSYAPGDMLYYTLV